MKNSLITLFSVFLAALPIEGRAETISHVRCGVLAGHSINIPYEFKNVTSSVKHQSHGSICKAELNSVAFSVSAEPAARPVSTSGWDRQQQAQMSIILEPSVNQPEATSRSILKSLYDKANYPQLNGYPEQPPKKIGSLLWIKGTPVTGGTSRNDFYLATDKEGSVDYLIHCQVTDKRENGTCVIGFQPEEMNLNMRVVIPAEDVEDYREISNKALKIVKSTISDTTGA